jgi:hypothetical protein
VPLERLTKARIQRALARLSELARERGVRLEMTLYGGALMMLAYDSRESTKDVDAVVHPKEIADELAARVAGEQGLHAGWLNDDVRQFVAGRETKHPLTVADVDHSHLKLVRPTAAYLLAMKAMACRPPLPGYAGDLADIAFLTRKMGLRSVEAVEEIVGRYFPDVVLAAPVRRRIAGAMGAPEER